MNTLFLVHSTESYWGKYIKENGYTGYSVFKDVNIALRFARRIAAKTSHCMGRRWLGSWADDVSEYGNIIIFANRMYAPVIRYIRKNAPQARIIVWYMDPYSACRLVIPDDIGVEQWSFDREDCERYGFRFSDTFYCIDEAKMCGNASPTGVFFVGEDKGRYHRIDDIRRYLSRENIDNKICIVAEKWTKLSPIENISRRGRKYDPLMPYEKVLEYVRGCEAMLEINQAKQSGLTQRALEALFYDKKLITDNGYIAQNDFYDPDNIYILKSDNYDGIRSFLETPMHAVSGEIKKKYTFESWLERFGLE